LVGTRWAHFNCNDKNTPRSTSRRSFYDKGRMKLAEKTNNLQFSQSPRWGALEASATAATSRSTSRSLAPHGAEPRAAMGAPVRSQSPPRGPCPPSCRRVEAAASGAARLPEHGIARPLPPR
jgi:hypothetical protein